MRARGSLFSKFMTRVGVYCLAQVAMILVRVAQGTDNRVALQQTSQLLQL
jgi:hypothetical protein